MRASEFVTEDSNKKIDASATSAIPGARIWPDLDNSSPYAAYRFGVALAGADRRASCRERVSSPV